MSRLFFYKKIRDVVNRLPNHYKKRYLENQNELAKEKFRATSLIKDECTGTVLPSSYFESPLNVIYPPESEKCLWGGEGIIQGYWEKKNQKQRFPKTWHPVLTEQLFYSEILDRWMIIIVSDSALKQIEESGGFDSYILSTPESKLKSRLGMYLKRDMLITLAKAKKNGNIKKSWQKFSEFIIPVHNIV
ncbi:unnamed protein product [Heterobilharzia americana]|nr:unnamed protein product [Heterobilharzia americana]